VAEISEMENINTLFSQWREWSLNGFSVGRLPFKIFVNSWKKAGEQGDTCCWQD